MTETNELLDKAKGFWANNNKIITYVGGGVIVLLLSWIGYQKLIKEPKELKAGKLFFLQKVYLTKWLLVALTKTL